METTSIEQELTDLILNCPELLQLERNLGRFNIFRVLRAERAEERHSNMLAWLLQPDESHGLGDTFLRRWLMRVMQDAKSTPPTPKGWIFPAAIDAIEIELVEVIRETENNIDLLVIIRRENGRPWVICIENKVESAQHSQQLDRYYKHVEERFTEAERRIYVFLTKYDEQPQNSEFISSSYDEIAQELETCINDKSTVGQEAALLLKHYLQLLEDDFMDDSEAARIARQIYLRHKKALDFILENKVDPIFEATNALHSFLQHNAAQLDIIIDKVDKGWVRFLPKAWDVPSNRGGKAWGKDSRYLLCLVGLWSKTAELHITAGKAPDAWADLIWERAAAAPFKQEWKKRPNSFVKPYKAKSDITISEFEGIDDQQIGSTLYNWLKFEIESPRFKEATHELSLLLIKLNQVPSQPVQVGT